MHVWLRFNELRRRVPGVTQHMLTGTLRDLETIHRLQRGGARKAA